MLRFFDHVNVFCFAASYAVALALELWHLFRPRPILRLIAIGFGVAGLVAHLIYLVWQIGIAKDLSLGSPTGSLYVLAFILTVFCGGEIIHHQRVAWPLFVLPVVLGLIGLGFRANELASPATPASLNTMWVWTHVLLVLLAAVGICIGFIASVMYLVQLRRLRAKVSPSPRSPVWNLERLELMNRRAVLASFPLLTAGLLIGVALQFSGGLSDWMSLRVLSVICLWLVFAILLYLRYRIHVRGRQLALWTMLAFAILVVALLTSHDFAHGGGS